MLKEALAQETVRWTAAQMAYEPAGLGHRRSLRQLEDRGDDGKRDVASCSIAPGTVMSHFPLPSAPAALAPSVISCAESPPLVAPCSAANGVSPGDHRTAGETVDIAAIALAANHDLAAAASAGVQAMGGRSGWLFGHERLDNSDDSPHDAQ